MTEAEWLACGEPERMLEHLRGRLSDRKLRLFGCACYRSLPGPFQDDSFRRVVEAAELYADARATWADMVAAWDRLDIAALRPRQGHGHGPGVYLAEVAVASLASARVNARLVAERTADAACELHNDHDAARKAAPGDEVAAARAAWSLALRARATERRAQADLLRCVVGNPFRPPPPLPREVLAWSDATVCRIAEGVYQERAFGLLPLLADALLDAGCADEEVLAHLRGPGPHTRGCWALDAVLGQG
jgi:hypothetical protein